MWFLDSKWRGGQLLYVCALPLYHLCYDSLPFTVSSIIYILHPLRPVCCLPLPFPLLFLPFSLSSFPVPSVLPYACAFPPHFPFTFPLPFLPFYFCVPFLFYTDPFNSFFPRAALRLPLHYHTFCMHFLLLPPATHLLPTLPFRSFCWWLLVLFLLWTLPFCLPFTYHFPFPGTCDLPHFSLPGRDHDLVSLPPVLCVPCPSLHIWLDTCAFLGSIHTFPSLHTALPFPYMVVFVFTFSFGSPVLLLCWFLPSLWFQTGLQDSTHFLLHRSVLYFCCFYFYFWFSFCLWTVVARLLCAFLWPFFIFLLLPAFFFPLFWVLSSHSCYCRFCPTFLPPLPFLVSFLCHTFPFLPTTLTQTCCPSALTALLCYCTPPYTLPSLTLFAFFFLGSLSERKTSLYLP